jgi:hypothetical protein
VKLDKHQVKKMIAYMKSVLNNNLEKRLQHANEPENFLDSEA